MIPTWVQGQSGTPAPPVSNDILLEDGVSFLLTEAGDKIAKE